VARWIARPMTWLATAAKPFVALLSLCTQWVLKLLRIDETHGRAVTAEEISSMNTRWCATCFTWTTAR